MWIMKWILASIVLGIDVMPYVQSHISERLNGYVVGYPLSGNFYVDTIVMNIRNLFPFEYGISGAVLLFILAAIFIVMPVATGRIVLRKTINGWRIGLYATLGFIPYVRYIVLHNHSYVHFFFTYRAQAATVMAICFIILELVQRTPKKAGGKQNA